MELQKSIKNKPNYKGDGVAVWLNKDKNGKTNLSIIVLNSIKLKAFENK